MLLAISTPESFVRFKNEIGIKDGDRFIGSKNLESVYITDHNQLESPLVDEVKQLLYDNEYFREVAIKMELVYIRNMEGIAYLRYIESFN